MLKGEFNLIDLFEQMNALKKMGPLSKIMDMVPGMSKFKLPNDFLDTQEGQLERWKFLMASMTKEELENPEIISHTRAQRIAAGSGSSLTEVRQLIKQYKKAKKLMKMFKGTGKDAKMQKMMKRFGLN